MPPAAEKQQQQWELEQDDDSRQGPEAGRAARAAPHRQHQPPVHRLIELNGKWRQRLMWQQPFRKLIVHMQRPQKQQRLVSKQRQRKKAGQLPRVTSRRWKSRSRRRAEGRRPWLASKTGGPAVRAAPQAAHRAEPPTAALLA